MKCSTKNMSYVYLNEPLAPQGRLGSRMDLGVAKLALQVFEIRFNLRFYSVNFDFNKSFIDARTMLEVLLSQFCLHFFHFWYLETRISFA